MWIEPLGCWKRPQYFPQYPPVQGRGWRERLAGEVGGEYRGGPSFWRLGSAARRCCYTTVPAQTPQRFSGQSNPTNKINSPTRKTALC